MFSHATPEKSEVEPKSTTPNGDKKDKESTAVNGVTTDVEMKDGSREADVPAVSSPTKETALPVASPSDKETAAPSTSTPSKDDVATTNKTSAESQPIADKVEVSATKPDDVPVTKSDDVPPASEDVDMKDATPVEEPKPLEKAPEKETLAEMVADEKKPEDTEMTSRPAEEPETVKESEKVNGTEDKAPPSSDEAALPTSEVDLHPESLSQLAIEPNEAASSTANASIEVVMGDAPPPTATDSSVTVKVAREREDDHVDEPAPKRAKTEPEEDNKPLFASTTAAPKIGSAPAETATSQEESPFKELALWYDSEFNEQKLTPFQRREIRKVLARVKKTKSGGHFKDSVQRLWPVLWDSYVAKIAKPTDLSQIDRTVREVDGAHVNMKDFRDELALMYENTLAFNGSMHDVTTAAFLAIRGIWEDVVHIPRDEPVRPKPAPKQKPPREPRVSAHVDPVVRKPSAGPGNSSPAVEARPSSFSSQERTLERRDSIVDPDRPKRTVRAPKPKDIDYTTKPSRKKLKPELQFSEEVLNDLMHPKNKAINTWFMDAVDAEGLGVPHYYSIVKKPMDLGKVARLLANGDITSLKEFDKAVRLIFTNCYLFNGSVDQGNAVSYVASQLEDYYLGLLKGKDAWLAKHAKATAPPPVSHGSDEEDEDDVEVEAPPAPIGVDYVKEVRGLENKLREESEKLNELFAADSPNQSLITVQQGILKMVQEALLKAKQELSEARQKQQEKPSKKSSKPSKPKQPSSAAPRKPSSSAAHPKKSGGSKKPAPKKTLTAADKDQIAVAMDDLEGHHLDRAIDIIKRDTGQNENTDGELELDIDQLSNEALIKLWELCKKALPGFGKGSDPPASPEVQRPAAKQSKPVPGSKPKKNKPMSAREQEERITQLRGLRDLYKPGNEPGDQHVYQAPTPTADSSDDDSDSEEE